MVEISKEAPQEITIGESHWQEMCSHVEVCHPEEACGLVAGIEMQVQLVIPVENILHSPVKYRMDPTAQLRAFHELDEQGLDLIAIFHSHPQGPDRPSNTDIQEAYYPEAVYLIFYPKGQVWSARAYLIVNKHVIEIPLILTGDI